MKIVEILLAFNLFLIISNHFILENQFYLRFFVNFKDFQENQLL